MNAVTEELKKLPSASQCANHACLFNIIVYAKETYRTAYIRDLVMKIIEKYPSRIIFVDENRDAAPDFINLTAYSADVGEGDLKVSCDLINIEVSSANLQRVPFLIIPNLLADLPVYLIWGQDVTQESDFFKTLQQATCRWIFDPESSDNFKAYCQTLLHFIKDKKIEIMDTQWAALSTWRDTLYQAFNTEERTEWLKSADGIHITYNTKPNELFKKTRIRALYLQAWIAGQLGWTFEKLEKKEEHHWLFTYTGPQGKIFVDLRGEERPELIPGRITHFYCHSLKGVEIDIRRKDQQKKVDVKFTSQGKEMEAFSMPIKDLFKSSTFLREIFYQRCSSHFYNTLKQLVTIFEKE